MHGSNFKSQLPLWYLLLSIVVVFSVPGCGSIVGPGETDRGSVTLSWLAPVLNEDDSPLNDLSGYHVYFGESPGTLSTSIWIIGDHTTATISDLFLGRTFYFAVTAFDYSLNESKLSNIVSTTLPASN